VHGSHDISGYTIRAHLLCSAHMRALPRRKHRLQKR
jgi:hypothetical protein